MATYSPADFENSPFRYGERVKVHLYTADGLLIKSITGTLAAREEKVNVARDPEGKPLYKTLYWIKDLEGYERPHPDAQLAEAGEKEKIEEGWFAEQDIEKIEEGPLTNLRFN